MNYIDTYKDISISSEVMGASPENQISLLFEKLHQNILISIQAINTKNTALKCKRLANANDIVLYFIDCLDFNADPQMAETLNGIYHHLQKLLFWANAKNDLEKLNEAKTISQNLYTWWTNAIS